MLGRVLGAHGLRGGLRVHVLGDGPENLMHVSSVALGASADDAAAPRYEVVEARPGRPGELRLALAGVRDRDAAQALRGRLVLAEAGSLLPAAEGEIYWYELVGCRVMGTDGRCVGRVREIWETGAHDVLVVEDAAGRTHLLPAARELLHEIDLPGRRIVYELLPGLLSEG